MKRSIYVLFFALCVFAGKASAQLHFDVTTSVDWTVMEIKAETFLNLESIGIRLPGGRTRAEGIIETEYPFVIRPAILNIPVDSSRTIGDLLNSGEISLRDVDALGAPIVKIPPALTPDLGFMKASYTVSLKNMGATLIRHTRAAPVRRPIAPLRAPAYTGIIIIATGKLPAHGKNTSSPVYPCLFPKIWDSDMNLVYERGITDPSKSIVSIVKYAVEDTLFRATPSGMDADIEALVGTNPLRIMARGVFGSRSTDPVIDRADALLILSSDENIRLLREARVVLILNPDILLGEGEF